MNDKDKEAFEKWCKNYFGEDATIINVPSYFIHTWQAVCEYMRSKANPLDALSLYEKLEKEREENKKLREALNFYANKYAWNGTHIGPSDYWFDDKQGYYLGGLKAREALKEVGEE